MLKTQIEIVINTFKDQVTALAKELLVQTNNQASDKKFNSLTNKALIAFWRAIEIFPDNEDINVTLIATKVASDIEKGSMKNQINNFTRTHDEGVKQLMMDEICQTEILRALNGYFLTGNVDQKILAYVLQHIH
ncbi:hypothetical protein SCHIN_v1c07120 [Spiroplasma chinense]|uniref:Uncharacterized protein n=1 Tax=Spiroplasma chinense TaxID=216932 RepID=A0A5B9Y6L7_9MOLU|nr:hypothetical protein [Spiroplasma chinense]QEH61907.1 hypothetical protein SCHIN_v1c07120 [Spiroplasma chinense]